MSSMKKTINCILMVSCRINILRSFLDKMHLIIICFTANNIRKWFIYQFYLWKLVLKSVFFFNIILIFYNLSINFVLKINYTLKIIIKKLKQLHRQTISKENIFFLRLNDKYFVVTTAVSPKNSFCFYFWFSIFYHAFFL